MEIHVSQTFKHPIIGQEAVCPDGLGRVIGFSDEFPDRWIRVQTYVNDRSCKWAPTNVALLKVTATSPEEVKDAPDAARWRKLVELAGYWQNGSETEVKLVQDDATRQCILGVGKARYYAGSFAGAIDQVPQPEEF